MKLTPKQERFIQEYLVDLNATQAATRAGYSAKSAETIGLQLLRKKQVSSAISQAQAKTANKLEITKERLISALLPIVDADVQHYQDIDEGGFVKLKQFKDMPKGASLAIKTITEDRIIKETPDGEAVIVKDQRRVDLYDKIRAVETIAKMLGFMTDGKVNADLNVNFRFAYDTEASKQ